MLPPLSLPSSPSTQRQQLLLRLATFTPARWPGEPISALECARRGWLLEAGLRLRCSACRASVSARLPSTSQVGVHAQCLLRLKRLLVEGHGAGCRWAAAPLPAAQLRPWPGWDPAQTRRQLAERTARLSRAAIPLPEVDGAADAELPAYLVTSLLAQAAAAEKSTASEGDTTGRKEWTGAQERTEGVEEDTIPEGGTVHEEVGAARSDDSQQVKSMASPCSQREFQLTNDGDQRAQWAARYALAGWDLADNQRHLRCVFGCRVWDPAQSGCHRSGDSEAATEIRVDDSIPDADQEDDFSEAGMDQSVHRDEEGSEVTEVSKSSRPVGDAVTVTVVAMDSEQEVGRQATECGTPLAPAQAEVSAGHSTGSLAATSLSSSSTMIQIEDDLDFTREEPETPVDPASSVGASRDADQKAGPVPEKEVVPETIEEHTGEIVTSTLMPSELDTTSNRSVCGSAVDDTLSVEDGGQSERDDYDSSVSDAGVVVVEEAGCRGVADDITPQEGVTSTVSLTAFSDSDDGSNISVCGTTLDLSVDSKSAGADPSYVADYRSEDLPASPISTVSKGETQSLDVEVDEAKSVSDLEPHEVDLHAGTEEEQDDTEQDPSKGASPVPTGDHEELDAVEDSEGAVSDINVAEQLEETDSEEKHMVEESGSDASECSSESEIEAIADSMSDKYEDISNASSAEGSRRYSHIVSKDVVANLQEGRECSTTENGTDHDVSPGSEANAGSVSSSTSGNDGLETPGHVRKHPAPASREPDCGSDSVETEKYLPRPQFHASPGKRSLASSTGADKGGAKRRRVSRGPLESHRSWCPWVTGVDGAPPGWRMARQLLMEARAELASVRQWGDQVALENMRRVWRTLDSWTAPASKARPVPSA